MAQIKVTLVTHGNAPDALYRETPCKLRDIVPNQEGKTVFLTRNGAQIQDIGPNTLLENGDTITVVANKNVGRNEGRRS